MTKDQLKEHLQNLNPEIEFVEEGEYLTSILPSVHLHKMAKNLRNSEETQFDFLFCQTAIDWPEYIDVVYHLRSTILEHSLVLKARINDRANAKIESVFDIWKTADFHEREIYDLFGVVFENHPDLRRIFLDDDWVGYPLRKDYEDEINIVEL